MIRTVTPDERIAFALIALGALALAGLSTGLLDAGFVDGVAELAGELLESISKPGGVPPLVRLPVIDVPLL